MYEKDDMMHDSSCDADKNKFFTEDTFPPSPGMIPEKSTKINNLAGPPGDGGEVLVGGKIW